MSRGFVVSRLWLGATAVIVVAGALVSVYWLYPSYAVSPARWRSERFSPVAWEAAPPEERYILVNDLIASKKLAGATRSEVIQLLGEPDSQAGEAYLEYVVKYADPNEPSLNFLYLLRVDLGPDDRVRQYGIRAD